MKEAKDLKVRCGEYDLGSEDEKTAHQERNVRTYTLHPFYTGPRTVIQDIAVIHTTKPFQKASNVDTTCTPLCERDCISEAHHRRYCNGF